MPPSADIRNTAPRKEPEKDRPPVAGRDSKEFIALPDHVRYNSRYPAALRRLLFGDHAQRRSHGYQGHPEEHTQVDKIISEILDGPWWRTRDPVLYVFRLALLAKVTVLLLCGRQWTERCTLVSAQDDLCGAEAVSP